MGLFWEEFEEGKEYVTRARTVTEADVVAFAERLPAASYASTASV